MVYPLVICYIAIEHDPRNSGFSFLFPLKKMVDLSSSLCKRLPEDNYISHHEFFCLGIPLLDYESHYQRVSHRNFMNFPRQTPGIACRSPVLQDLPAVPGAFVIRNAFSPEETTWRGGSCEWSYDTT